MDASLKRILLEKLRLFCVSCTLHGAYYLPKGRGACMAWGAIMLAGLALWGALSHMIWHKYSTDPTVTVVESTYYPSDQIPFPAVMICDSNPVYEAKTKNVSQILSSRGYSETEIVKFYNSFLDIHNTSYVPPTYIRNMHSLLQDMGLTLETLLEMFKKPCNVTIVSCSWRSKAYSCTDMFYEVATTVGHCCYFDIAYFGGNAPINTTLKPGFTSVEGLEVTVNGIKSFSNGTVKDGPVLLYILDTADNVTNMESPISMSHSCYYDVDIEVFVIDSSSEVKALPRKSRKCSIESDEGISGRRYRACIAILLMRKVVNNCKCLPFMYSDTLLDEIGSISNNSKVTSISSFKQLYAFSFLTSEALSVGNYPSCIFEQYLCVYPQLEMYLADLQSIIDMNDCYQRCDYAEYAPTAEFIRMLNARRKNNSFTKVAIAYAATTCLKYRREVIYTWDQMLANLGGIFGLCLGGSIISIIEIIWFLIDLLVTTCNYKKKPTETVFVIEKHVAKKNNKIKDLRNKFLN